jgi:hypothetical protein
MILPDILKFKYIKINPEEVLIRIIVNPTHVNEDGQIDYKFLIPTQDLNEHSRGLSVSRKECAVRCEILQLINMMLEKSNGSLYGLGVR